MNIIDTSSSSLIANKEEMIKNIPLFNIRPINYLLPEGIFTDVIFQSTASVKNFKNFEICNKKNIYTCLLYTSPSPRDLAVSRMPSSA